MTIRTYFLVPVVVVSLLTLVGCSTYVPAPPYNFVGTATSSTITFRSDFPTWTSISREIRPQGKDYCQAQFLGYTEQPGFTRIDRLSRNFGPPDKPRDQVEFKVQEDQPITLEVQTIIAQYDKMFVKCGPKFIRFTPQPGASYSLRFVKENKDNDRQCRLDLQTSAGPVAFEELPALRGGLVVCD